MMFILGVICGIWISFVVLDVDKVFFIRELVIVGFGDLNILGYVFIYMLGFVVVLLKYRFLFDLRCFG